MAKFTSSSKAVLDLFQSYVDRNIWQNSVIDHWDRSAQVFPDREAIVDSRRRLTWAQAKLASDRLALGLRDLGMERDESMAVLLPWSVDFALVRIAHEKAGLVCAEFAYTLRHREISFFLSHSNARAIVIPRVYRGFDYFGMIQEIRGELPQLRHVIVAGPDVLEGAISLDAMIDRPIEDKYPSDYLAKQRHSPFELSTLWHTTGTTGLPKLVESAPAGVEWAGRKHESESGPKLTSDDVTGVICPAIAGPNVLIFYSAVQVGAKIAPLEHFRPADALKLIEQEKVTVTAVVPAQLAMILECTEFGQYDLSSLRYIVCAGASLNYELASRAEDLIGCPVVQHYGSMEDGVVTLVQHFSEPRAQRLLTVGKPSVDCETRIIGPDGHQLPLGEVGSIEARGPCMQGGYHKDVEATRGAWTEDGYCKLGDLGKFDEHGNIVLVGRSKEVILRGGQNIYPIEVENVLLSHPSVALAAVVPMPDVIMGEKACAFIVPKAGSSFSFEEMVAHFKAKQVAAYKIPERLEVRQILPLAGDQKVDKPALKRELAGG